MAKYTSMDSRKKPTKNARILSDLATGKTGLKKRNADQKKRNAPVEAYERPRPPSVAAKNRVVTKTKSKGK